VCTSDVFSFVLGCQAQDGIRVFHVTGVQTCALPIFSRFTEPTPEALAQALAPGLFGGGGAMLDLREVGEAEWKALKPLLESVPEIGRASCRERVWWFAGYD